MATWLWTIHNFVHQTVNTVKPKRSIPFRPYGLGAVAVLYTTCDDFDPVACLSGIKQSHRNTRLIICDDSRDESSRGHIDRWAAQVGPRVTIMRRPDSRGLKAGNLNYAIATAVREEFIVVCDADEVLPEDFVARILCELELDKLAFVQCRHTARNPAQSWFEEVLGPAIDVFYRFTLPSRNRFGFTCCFGHGLIGPTKCMGVSWSVPRGCM